MARMALKEDEEDVARHGGHQAARNLIAIRLPPLSPTEAGLLADADGFLDVLFHLEPFVGDTIFRQFTTE